MKLNELLKNKEFSKSVSKYLKDKSILDIFVFGSAVRNKELPSDLDIAVLISFKNENTESLIYEFRKSLEKIAKEVHVITLEYSDLISENFVARNSFLTEAYSLRKREFFNKSLGFAGYVMFLYSLSEFSNSPKVLFHYALNGRNGKEGILKKLSGKKLSDSSIVIPIENSDFFKEFLDSHKIKYSFWNCLLPTEFK